MGVVWGGSCCVVGAAAVGSCVVVLGASSGLLLCVVRKEKRVRRRSWLKVKKILCCAVYGVESCRCCVFAVSSSVAAKMWVEGDLRELFVFWCEGCGLRKKERALWLEV